jgi:hypothetical protein
MDNSRIVRVNGYDYGVPTRPTVEIAVDGGATAFPQQRSTRAACRRAPTLAVIAKDKLRRLAHMAGFLRSARTRRRAFP